MSVSFVFSSYGNISRAQWEELHDPVVVSADLARAVGTQAISSLTTAPQAATASALASFSSTSTASTSSSSSSASVSFTIAANAAQTSGTVSAGTGVLPTPTPPLSTRGSSQVTPIIFKADQGQVGQPTVQTNNPFGKDAESRDTESYNSTLVEEIETRMLDTMPVISFRLLMGDIPMYYPSIPVGKMPATTVHGKDDDDRVFIAVCYAPVDKFNEKNAKVLVVWQRYVNLDWNFRDTPDVLVAGGGLGTTEFKKFAQLLEGKEIESCVPSEGRVKIFPKSSP